MTDINDKFPPERKQEFLNWVMLTQSKDEWSDMVLKYMEHYQLKNWYKGMEFTIKWSDDSSAYVYWMVKHGYTNDTEWVMKVIENAKTGDPSYVAYWMVRNGYAPQEWAMRVIENDKIGNPFLAAYYMVKDGYAPQEWYYRNFRQNIIIGKSEYDKTDN